MEEYAFSLVELLVVMSMLLSLTAISTSVFSHSVSREKSVSRVLRHLMEEFQLDTLTPGQEVVLAPHSDTLEIIKYNARTASKTISFSSNNLSALTSSPSTLRFYNPVVHSPATLSFVANRSACSVSLSLRGRIRTSC